MKDKIKEKYWSRFEATYDQNQEYVVGRNLLDEVRTSINKLNDLGEVLELGCGTGYFTNSLLEISNHIFATDLSAELLEEARERLGNNDKITLQIENCYNTSFKTGKFDTIFMANLIHVIENPSKVLQECFRVLKDNGLLIITSFTSNNMKLLEVIKLSFRYIKVWGKPPKHTNRFSSDCLSSLMKSAGFNIEESKVLGDRTKSLFIAGRKIKRN